MVEIERKFLVRDRPPGLERHPRRRIRQGYLAVDGDTEVRLRSLDDERFLTVKHGGGRSRIEEEIPIDERAWQALWPATAGRRVEKVRYAVPHEGLTVEVDVYDGPLDGLVTAEVEFEDERAADAFAPLAWMGREVTGEPAWKNRELARRGRPPER
jgi:CYTH domain-containing protein